MSDETTRGSKAEGFVTIECVPIDRRSSRRSVVLVATGPVDLLRTNTSRFSCDVSEVDVVSDDLRNGSCIFRETDLSFCSFHPHEREEFESKHALFVRERRGRLDIGTRTELRASVFGEGARPDRARTRNETLRTIGSVP